MDDGPSRSPLQTPMLSALYVDLDNFVLALRKHAPDALAMLLRNPGRLLDWLTGEAMPASHFGARRLLVRRVYVNPTGVNGWHRTFVNAGFETVDCPPLAGRGGGADGFKNAADIRIAVDVMDDLCRLDGIQEVIVCSADSDFTPLLHRVRSRAVWTTIVATGPMAAAYRAVADMVIGPERLVAGIGGGAVRPAERAPLRAPATDSSPAPATCDIAETEGGDGIRLTADLVAEHVAMLVADADRPLIGPEVTEALQLRFGDALHQPARWLGHATLFRLLRVAARTDIVLDARPGRAEIRSTSVVALAPDDASSSFGEPGFAAAITAEIEARLAEITV